MSAIQVTITHRSTLTITPTCSANVLVLDGKTPRAYQIFVGNTYCTVCAGKFDRRTIGRTFHTLEELAKHYKRDGSKLVEIVTNLREEISK